MDDNNKTQSPVLTVQNPAGSVNKEMGPVGASTAQVSELQPAGAEVGHAISQELKDLGVEETKERPDLAQTPNVQHAGHSVPVKTEPSGLIQPLLTEEEAVASIRTKKNSDSGRWLAGLILKVLKVMRLREAKI
ncbi:MAG: hypothetical protein HY425_01285 [Candidatus Levybacteria bacterium]|nr:hypothetical protein [Candidatus Levybacteria bacterium]